MSSKRKNATPAGGKSKKNKKNGKKAAEEFSDYDDEFKSDVESGNDTDPEPLPDDDNESELADDGLRVQGPAHVGRLIVCGAFNWDLYNRKSVPKNCKMTVARNIETPERFKPLDDKKIRVAVSGCNAAHSIFITEDYKVYCLGRNERGQLGTGDTDTRYDPYFLESMQNHKIVNAACGRNHTLLLTDRGTVYAMGDNKMGQCGVGSKNPTIMAPTRVRYRGPPIVKVVCGGDFSVILDLKGNLHSFGDPEYGQLGHNCNGEFLIAANKMIRQAEKSPRIITTYIEKTKDSIKPIEPADFIDVACGTNHTIALDSKRRIFSWGFGGYGRLGHAEPKDEMVPRLIKFFETQGKGAKAVYCGSQFSLVVSDHKVTYLFGKTKNTGEVNMYPKPVQDLMGWNVRSVGAGGTCIMMAADSSTIGFGPSPTYGALGFGELNKSSSVPKEVKALDGIHVESVSMGATHTLMIAREASPEDTKKIEALGVHEP
ncbi:Regulator of chromosome condensation (RCC1) repeat [Nesidiocoris tenuis]|uniref:Regulator of chromosome condensation (RCC1) repeat n=1 Tax=Nesidiocoris tenuis TaxID=355587 RepID=A0ABN7BBS5_9HEMI|nr:Regulator of chromosome condensation (RCC1) repeat [Nesidiocoris tenuis]